MSQADVLDFLEKYKNLTGDKNKFTAPQIQYHLGLGKAIYPNLKKLVKEGRIQWELIVDPKNKQNKATRYWIQKERWSFFKKKKKR